MVKTMPTKQHKNEQKPLNNSYTGIEVSFDNYGYPAHHNFIFECLVERPKVPVYEKTAEKRAGSR